MKLLLFHIHEKYMNRLTYLVNESLFNYTDTVLNRY